MTGPGKLTVTGLCRYPVKSCTGTSLDEAAVGFRGIIHDCEFMVVDALTGLFLTQRELPLITLAGFRRTNRGVLFGQNMIHNRLGTIRRGERVEVLA